MIELVDGVVAVPSPTPSTISPAAGPSGPDGTTDGDGPYLTPSGGTWGTRVETTKQGECGPASAVDVAHEVGHLLGLGDDYTDTAAINQGHD